MLKEILHKLAGRFGYVVKRRRTAITRGGGSALANLSPADLMTALHGGSIYEGFDFQAYPNDPAGWGGTSPAFSELIAAHRPKFIIEVGSWKGSSAITMANLLAEQGNDGIILCIDTWLGAIEFWCNQADPERWQALRCKHGYPQVYYDFLANVCHAGHQERIVPFPIHSSSGAFWLLQYGIVADMIYIDASHEDEDVYQDMNDYYALVRSGGILFGDDWSWPGVKSAVSRFAKENRLEIEMVHDKWVIRKS
jgi:hypothetical protein